MDREKVINDLNAAKLILCNPQMLTPEMCIRIGQAITSVLALLKEQPEIVRCKDCKYYDYFNGCMSWHDVNSNNDNWYCADGDRR